VTGFALAIKTVSNRNRVVIGLDHRVQRRTELLNAIQVTLNQILRTYLTGRHRRLQLRDTHLNEREIRTCERARFEQRRETSGEECGASSRGWSDKISPADVVILDVC